MKTMKTLQSSAKYKKKTDTAPIYESVYKCAVCLYKLNTYKTE